MPFETIDEPVKVLASFDKGVITPLRFRWRERLIDIKEINFIHRIKDGSILSYIFSVSNSTGAFRLKFNAATMQWRLDQVYQDG